MPPKRKPLKNKVKTQQLKNSANSSEKLDVAPKNSSNSNIISPTVNITIPKQLDMASIIPKLTTSSELSYTEENTIANATSESETESPERIQIIKPQFKRKSISVENFKKINTSYDFFKENVDDSKWTEYDTNSSDTDDSEYSSKRSVSSERNTDDENSDINTSENVHRSTIGTGLQEEKAISPVNTLKQKCLSTPDLSIVPRFQLEKIQNMNTYHLLLIYEKITKQRKKGSQIQAKQYLNYIIEKIRQEQLDIPEKEENYKILEDVLRKNNDKIESRRHRERMEMISRLQNLHSSIEILKALRYGDREGKLLKELKTKEKIDPIHIQLIQTLEKTVYNLTIKLDETESAKHCLTQENINLKERLTREERTNEWNEQEIKRLKEKLKSSINMELEIQKQHDRLEKKTKLQLEENNHKLQEQERRIKYLENRLQQKEEKLEKITNENKNLQQLIRKPPAKHKETSTTGRQKDKNIQTKLIAEELDKCLDLERKQYHVPEMTNSAVQTHNTVGDLKNWKKINYKQLENVNSIESSAVSDLDGSLHELLPTTTNTKQHYNNNKLEEKLKNLEKILAETRNIFNLKQLDSQQNNESDSAILIRKLNKETTLKQIQETINSHLLEVQLPFAIHSRLSRNRDTIIIKTNTNEHTDELLKSLEQIKELQDLVEITYKEEHIVKLIITGIPEVANKDKLIQDLREHYGTSSINLNKYVKRKGASTYSIIIEVDKNLSSTLLNKHYLSIGLNSCRISVYRPIIRCANCQLYGHSTLNCRRKTICAYCSRGHSTDNCIYKNDKAQHRCANCIGSENYFRHTANSPLCPIYISQIKYRNHSINNLT